jgi:hypothetical protein
MDAVSFTYRVRLLQEITPESMLYFPGTCKLQCLIVIGLAAGCSYQGRIKVLGSPTLNTIAGQSPPLPPRLPKRGVVRLILDIFAENF